MDRSPNDNSAEALDQVHSLVSKKQSGAGNQHVGGYQSDQVQNTYS